MKCRSAELPKCLPTAIHFGRMGRKDTAVRDGLAADLPLPPDNDYSAANGSVRHHSTVLVVTGFLGTDVSTKDVQGCIKAGAGLIPSTLHSCGQYRNVGGFLVKSAFAFASKVVLAAALLFAGAQMYDTFASKTIDRSGPTILLGIRAVEEFTAAEGTFMQDVDIEVDPNFLPSFVSGERVVALVTGSVRATVDFRGLDEDSIEVDEESSTIRITIPEPILSDVDIDEKSVQFLDRERGFTDRIADVFATNPTDDSPVFVMAEGRIIEAAVESDLHDRGRANTEQWLRSFFAAAGFENVIINWQQPNSSERQNAEPGDAPEPTTSSSS